MSRQGRATDVIYLGFCKAFDRVPCQHPSLQVGFGGWTVDKELAGWLYPEDSGQGFNICAEVSRVWCPPGVHIGTRTVKYLHQLHRQRD